MGYFLLFSFNLFLMISLSNYKSRFYGVILTSLLYLLLRQHLHIFFYIMSFVVSIIGIWISYVHRNPIPTLLSCSLIVSLLQIKNDYYEFQATKNLPAQAQLESSDNAKNSARQKIATENTSKQPNPQDKSQALQGNQ